MAHEDHGHDHPHDHDHDHGDDDHHGDWQRQQTAVTWQALLDNGAREGGPLVVDSYFYADDEAPARALAAALEAHGTTVEVEPGRLKGLLRKAVPWAVVGSTTLAAASLDALTTHIEQMQRLAADLGVEYDGWGAEVPEG